MIRWLATGASAIFAFIAAAWLHELTHAAAARVLGAEVLDVNLTALYVDYRWPTPSPRRERLVLLAPGLVGIALSPLLVVLWSGRITAGVAISVVAWVIYTLNGGADGELSLTA